MKFKFSLLLLLIIFSLFISNAKNKHVETTSSVNYNSKYSKLELIIYFKPVKGIHINLEPPVKLTFTSEFVLQKQKFKRTKDNYLDTTSPFIFVLNLKNKKNIPDSLTANLEYFYCSGEEGWCNKFTEELKFEIKLPASK